MDIFEAQSAKPMLIGLDGEAFDSPEYTYELKLDGERCLAYLGEGETMLINRRGKHILPNFPELGILHKLVDGRCILDGELITGTGTKPDFELVKQRTLVKHPRSIQRLSARSPATLVAIDVLYNRGRQLTETPLEKRQAILEKIVRENRFLARSRPVAKNGIRFFDLVKRQGLEGIIAKRLDSFYRMGKRTRDWIKIKNWLEDTFVICGYVPAANAAVVSLILGQYAGAGELAYKGRVTLGVKQKDFSRIAAQPMLGKPPFAAQPRDVKAGAVWIRPDLVCLVGFMCWTTGLRLRQPFYKRLVEMPPGQVHEYLPANGCHSSLEVLT